MSSEKYVKNAVTTVEDLLNEDGDGYHLKTMAREPVPHSYKTELDITNELNLKLMLRYRQLIGILRWAVERRQIDIYHEIVILSQYLASPCEGHLEALYHIFAYLKRHHKFSHVFNPKYVQVSEDAFQTSIIARGRIFMVRCLRKYCHGCQNRLEMRSTLFALSTRTTQVMWSQDALILEL